MTNGLHTKDGFTLRWTWVLIAAAVLAVAVTVGFAPSAGALTMRSEVSRTPTATAHPAAHVRRTRPYAFHTMATPATEAKRAGINPTVAPFSFFLVYHPFNAREIALKAFEIKPFFVGQAPPIGGCLHCLGNGIFQPYTVKHHVLEEKIKGTRLLSTKTRFGQGILRRGEIGRFKVLGVALNPARPFARQQGCLGADTGVTSNDLIYGHKLPLIGCHGANPTDFATSFNGPVELSKTSSLQGTVKGRTRGKRWLTVFQVHATCGPTAQATAHVKGALWAMWNVNGTFNETFNTAPDSHAGNYCVYLQSGGLWHKVPDGRISQRGQFAYFSGDTVSISSPTPVAPGQTATNTFSGYASGHEYLWTFDSTSSCAPTAQGEYGPSLGYAVNSVHGLFNISIQSVPLTQSTYRCAYLSSGTPHHISGNNYSPTGTTLATASVLVPVT